MPVTTFINYKIPKHPHKELQRIIDDCNDLLGDELFFAEYKIYQKAGFLSTKIDRTILYFRIDDSEYQVINGVKDVDTALMYMYGYYSGFVDKNV